MKASCSHTAPCEERGPNLREGPGLSKLEWDRVGRTNQEGQRRVHSRGKNNGLKEILAVKGRKEILSGSHFAEDLHGSQRQIPLKEVTEWDCEWLLGKQFQFKGPRKP